MGFRVYATVLDQNNSGSQLLSNNNNIHVLQMDVTNQSQIDQTFDFVSNDLQNSGYQLWAIVNNAGVISSGHIEWGTFDEWEKVFDINLFGGIRVTRKFIPLIRRSKGIL